MAVPEMTAIPAGTFDWERTLPLPWFHMAAEILDLVHSLAPAPKETRAMADLSEWPWSAKIGSVLGVVVVVGGGIWQVAANTTAIATLNPEAIKEARNTARDELVASTSGALTQITNHADHALAAIADASQEHARDQRKDVSALQESIGQQRRRLEEYGEQMDRYLRRQWCSHRGVAREPGKRYENTEDVPIEVSVSATTEGEGPSRCDFEVAVNGQAVVREINLAGGQVCGAFLTVPPGASYEVRRAVDQPLRDYELDIFDWHELRPSC